MTWEINNLLPTENPRGKKSCPENQGKIAEIPGPRGQNQPENAWKIPTLSPENPRPFPDIPGVGITTDCSIIKYVVLTSVL